MTEQSHPSFNDRSASSFGIVPPDTPHFRNRPQLILGACCSRRPFGVLIWYCPSGYASLSPTRLVNTSRFRLTITTVRRPHLVLSLQIRLTFGVIIWNCSSFVMPSLRGIQERIAPDSYPKGIAQLRKQVSKFRLSASHSG